MTRPAGASRAAEGPPDALALWLEETRGWVDAELDRRLPHEDEPPARLHAALRYAVFGGGKRLRPALVRLAASALGGTEGSAAAPAAAIELVHAYSLVHDDLPCMDDDDLRRGRATVHVRFGEATAVLVGDGLLTLAFRLLAEAPIDAEAARECARVLARAAGTGGMVGGQELDLDRAGSAVDLAACRDVHARKTAALIEASAEIGAVVAGAGGERRAAVRAFGHALGMLFQAVDDVLDVTGDAETLGKTPGKDAAQEKGSLVSVLGLEGARAEATVWADRALAAAGEVGWEDGGRAAALVRLFLGRTA